MRRVFVAMTLATALHAQSPVADLVLVNGKVITVDARDRVAQAIAVRDKKIVAVGTDAEIARWVGPKTERIDLKGHAVTPGLIDAHAHILSGAISRYTQIDLQYPNATRVAQVQALVAARAKELSAGAWVLGDGWDEGKLDEKRLLRASDLDAVSGDHPVWLAHTTGHYGVANSAALRLAGITRDSKDPPAGTIDRDADGTPTGVLKESAQILVTRLIPPTSAAESERSLSRLTQELNREGMTAFKDPSIDATDWAAYQAVRARGELSARAFVLWGGQGGPRAVRRIIEERGATTRPYESTGDDHLISGGVKLFADGSGGARTAWVWSPWNRNTVEMDGTNTGYPAMNPDSLRESIRLLHNAGIHVSVHAIGDRAIDWVVQSYAQVLAERPTKGLRHGIIHANIPSDSAIATIARLQRDYDAAYPEPSATFTWYIGDVYAANFGARAKRLNPFATFQRNGIRWANGSDFPVTPFPARYGIWSAVARQTLLQRDPNDPFGRAESVDVRTALKAVTIWAAHQLFLDTKVGSIEVGKYADLAVWDRDPYTVPSAQLKDMTCQLTLLDGRVVYRAP
ncbi:MAG: amidohydrolase [Gemmatimonadaceae bacterium]|nr:amidohydrolase [Gemmatimonadaceae bacterium]